jgi:hypothetical protein
MADQLRAAQEQITALTPSDMTADECALAVFVLRQIRRGQSYDAVDGIWWDSASKPGVLASAEARIAELESALQARASSGATVEAPKQPKPCPKCGTWLWDDPRPCWSCARIATYPEAAPPVATTGPDNLWILRHQILPNLHGLKYAALSRVLETLEAQPSSPSPTRTPDESTTG